MDAHELQTALAQVLENYRRCGITRFATPTDSLIAAEDLVRISQLSRNVAAPHDGGQSYQPLAAIASTEPPQRTHASRAVDAPVAPLQSSTNDLASSAWSLPVLQPEARDAALAPLQHQVRDCRLCGSIVSYRQQTVFGDGPLTPTVCFMGEAPGADEDRTGKPFVGKAGQLLTKIIAAMKLRREEVYILNALKCRPPQNRTPMNDEIENCRHFVENQLDILQPQFIVCLGAVAVRSLLRSDLSIGRLRGKFHSYRGASVVVTYHPSYLLRNESAKRLVWEDMKMLMERLPASSSPASDPV